MVKHNDERVKVEVYGIPENPDYYYSYARSGQAFDNEIVSEGSTNWDFKIPFVDNKKKTTRKPRFSFEVGGVGVGFVNAMNAPAPMDVDMGSSYEIFADHILNLRCYPWATKNTSFSIGFGIGWRNYRMTGRTRFLKEGDRLTLAPYPDGADIDFSRIKVFSLTFPLRFRQELSRHFSYSLAAILNLNTYASAKTHYDLDGTPVRDVQKRIHPSRVTVDFMGQVQFHSVGLYVKYSPCRMLNTDFGPDFSHLSAGITLFY